MSFWIWIYRFLYLPIFCMALPFYLRRMWRRGGYRVGFLQRFGWMPCLPKKTPDCKRIWIQAVSVGELQSIRPLIENFLAHGYEIVLTTTTSTGFALAKAQYLGKVLHVGLFPLDFWPCSVLAWNRIQPDRVLHVDSELWPEHLYQAALRHVPLDVCNARLSDRSFRRYRFLKKITGVLWCKIRYLLVANEIDFDRFMQIGRLPLNTHVTGNLKFDQPFPSLLSHEEKKEALIKIGMLPVLDEKPLVLLGSSTWEGEEIFLVKTFLEAKALNLALILILVPRHPERRISLKGELNALPVKFHFRSSGVTADAGTQVYITDTMGELDFFTNLADVVMIGKSFFPHVGGQSPVAAAALGVPMIFGPEMSNFRSLAKDLVHLGAAYQLNNEEEAKTVLLNLLQSADKRNELSHNARQWYLKNQGATNRTLAYLLRDVKN